MRPGPCTALLLLAPVLAGCAAPLPASPALDPMGDADGDGLCNAGEAARGLDPAHWDTDRDGFADGVEAHARAAAHGPPGCVAGEPAAWADLLDPAQPDLVVQPFVMVAVPTPPGWLDWLEARLARIPGVAPHVLPPLPLAHQPVEAPSVPARPAPIHRLVVVHDLLGLDGGWAYGRAEAPGHDAHVAAGRIAREDGHRFARVFQHVVLHELGHNLGLPHAEGPDAAPTAMREQFRPGHDDLTAEEWAMAGQRYRSASSR
jgi:hypothetical protein